MVLPSELTDSKVKKAGRTLRRTIRGEIPITDPRVEEAKDIAQTFRALHQKPLAKANMGLRSMVQTSGCQVEVSQRMKRWATILDKLMREPQLPLHKMQDIGGCRAILNSVDEIRRVESRIKKNRPVTGYSDYIAEPRASGYRGVHVVVLYDDRQIEIQLRTWVMHEWAITVERLASRVGTHLKSDGTHAIQLLMAAISEAMALEEQGKIVPEDLQSEIQRRRLVADPYLKGTA
ncbi:RelA/SpoT domain-containing protein [Nocardioides sp. J54]|uniref:RelA/SpoT domain-containing protein n=1 Tax=Nocardioides sp. J54 TaxID=935866 RepID=UPI00048FD878|nr:RelA/SpoT domain-containing protein [Nocardioides sp. J54]